MYVVLLKFSEKRAEAGRLMDGHRAWLQKGFEEGVFLMAGSLQPKAGGAILAHGTSPEALRRRVEEDPLVAEDVVRAEILEIDPSRTDPRLAFLAA
ncbi:YciI family protein [Xanthobacter autotrophicus DSM 431]|uniref:YciI family protein n=1 Tax=Xanthobacter nonsaccharivorans TaxID=3119912 RepID=UPI00372A548D